MNKCLICDEDSGFGMVCEECKEALKHYKYVYFTRRLLDETTELDDEMFAHLYKSARLDEIANDELFNAEWIPSILADSKVVLMSDPSLEWLRKKEGRMDAFMKYAEDRMRETCRKAGKGG